MSLSRLESEYLKLWKRRGSIGYKTSITEDDLQEAFYYILANKMENFESMDNGSAYIYMIAKTKAYKRYTKKNDTLRQTSELKDTSLREGANDNLYDEGLVDDCVKSISDPTLRRCIELRLQGYSVRELIKMYQISPTTFNRKFSDFKQKISRIL